ncbi:putative glycerophosphodiester phosphodiesterase [Dioscorea sansibarensis]
MIKDVERKLCMIGLWCIQMRPSNRPSMSIVIEMLEDDVHSLQMPPKPFFLAPNPLSSKATCVTSTNEELTSVYEDDQY